MSDFGKLLERSTFRIERTLPGPGERVWAFLTEAEKRAEWLAGGDFELRPGGRAEFVFDHRKLTVPDDKPPKKYERFAGETRFDGRILDAQAPHLLVFEWPEASGDISEVRIELKPHGERIRLELTHSRLLKRNDLVNTSAGWHTHLEILCAKLAGEAPPHFWATLTRLEAEYETRLPAS